MSQRAQEINSLCTYNRAGNSTIYPVITNIFIFIGLDYTPYYSTVLPAFNRIRVSILKEHTCEDA